MFACTGSERGPQKARGWSACARTLIQPRRPFGRPESCRKCLTDSVFLGFLRSIQANSRQHPTFDTARITPCAPPPSSRSCLCPPISHASFRQPRARRASRRRRPTWSKKWSSCWTPRCCSSSGTRTRAFTSTTRTTSGRRAAAGSMCWRIPAAPKDQWKIRPVIDPTTPETLGLGVYTHPGIVVGRHQAAVLLQGRADGQHEHLRDRRRRAGIAADDGSRAAPATATRAATAASTTSPRPTCPTAGSCSCPRGPAAWSPAPTRAWPSCT